MELRRCSASHFFGTGPESGAADEYVILTKRVKYEKED